VVLVGASIGLVFAAVSTYDFVQHLDRQVHNLHCSFIPGVSQGGESGCQVAMMSPYSSVLRSTVWGGIPISLAAMSVFAFLVFYALDLAVTRRKGDPRATGLLALATVLPAATSLVMLVISLAELGTTCKLCVGIYAASALCLIGGLALWRGAVRDHRAGAPVEDHAWERRDRHHDEPAFIGTAKTDSGARLVAVGVDTGAVSTGFLAGMFAIGVAFVAIPVALYVAMAPDHARFIGTCEGLPKPEDSYGVMVRIDRAPGGGVPAIEVLDPLCPACRAFEQRLAASGLAARLDRKAVLFPLDNTCNWMVTEATHPGACTVSEAVLCAGDKAPQVIAWAFETQERIRSEARTDPAAAARIVKQRFPELASCIGSPEARSRLNKSMRWIVANNIRVLTPQLFVDRVKLCDEDVDLGLEYTLSNMLERHARGRLAVVPLEKAPGSAASDGAEPGGVGAPSDSATPDPSASGKAPEKAATDGTGAGTATPETAAPEKAAPEKAASEKAAPEKAAREKAAPEKAAAEKAASEKAASEKAASEKAASEKAASEKAASEKAAPEKAASEKAAPEPANKAAADKAAADKAAADKAAADKAAADKAAADKAAADKAAADKAAADKAPADIPSDRSPDSPASGPVTRPGDTP
jgi:uncharacterized membrane protein